MIEWKINDRKLVPDEEKLYLVTDGEFINIGWFGSDGLFGNVWHAQEGGILMFVTHYAEINLPKPNPVITEEDPNQVTLDLDGKLRGGK